MRHLFGLFCVCPLGLMPLVGCETADEGGTGGTAGGGGAAGGGGSAGDGGSGGDGNYISEVPIMDSSFELKFEERGDTNWEISGTFDGDNASGTARVSASLGMGGFFCELAGGWTATATAEH